MAAGDPTDPTTVATQTTIDQQNAYTTALQNTTTAVNDGTVAQQNYVQNGLQKVTNAAGFAAAGLLSVSAASQKFAAGIDTGKISTFSGQLDAIAKAAVRPGMAVETLQKAGFGLLEMIKRMGGGTAQTSGVLATLAAGLVEGGAAAAGAVKGLADYAKNVVALGDEMKVGRMALIQQAAAVGSLDSLLHKAGRNMQDFNSIVQKQQQIWVNAQKATGLAQDEIAKYSAQINKIPGVMDLMISGVHGGNKANRLFIDSLKLMEISGRNYEDIMKDMNIAVMEFGSSQKGALDFATRMSVAAKELKIPVEELNKAVTSSASAFKMFAGGQSDMAVAQKNADGMTKNLEITMSRYIAMLRSVNIPMGNATEMAQHFTGAIQEMTLGQKAFLNQMTGGPGGLMGAFQIEKLMDEGKVDQVFGRVQSALRKQFGRIVTTEEASRSQAAAEAMTRQMMILRQGPLGSFAKSDAEARRLLDAMGKGTPPDKALKDLQKDAPMERFLQQGNKIAQGSQGILNEISSTLAGGEYATAAGAAKVTEPVLGARVYSRTGEGVGVPEAMERRRQFAATGERPGGATLLETTMKDLKNLPTSLKDTLKTLSVALSSGNKESVEMANAKVQQSIAAFKASAAAMPEDERKKMMDSAKALTTVVSSAVTDARAGVSTTPTDTAGAPTVPPPSGGRTGATSPATGGTAAVRPGPLTPEQMNRKVTDYMRAHPGTSRADAISQVNNPAKDTGQSGSTSTPGTGGGSMAFGQPGRPMPVTLAPGSTIAVNFVGVCPHCKSSINSTEVGKTVNPAAAMHR
jgi:hypothetical protein